MPTCSSRLRAGSSIGACSTDQDVARLPRGRNRRSRSEDAHDRGAGQAAWHSAGLADLTLAGKSVTGRLACDATDIIIHSCKIRCDKLRNGI